MRMQGCNKKNCPATPCDHRVEHEEDDSCYCTDEICNEPCKPISNAKTEKEIKCQRIPK